MFKIVKNNWDFIGDKQMEELERIYNSISNFYPSNENVLRFLNMDFQSIRCIIVGMEPYPSSYWSSCLEFPEATGRSFEVASLKDKTWLDKFKQSSLRNILKTVYYNETGMIKPLEDIRQEIASGDFQILPPGEWFDSLENQGVLFLNATLTVEPWNVGSHTSLWGSFMDDLIRHICRNLDAKWFLWGKDARNRVLPVAVCTDIYCFVHPRLNPFIKQNCFQYAADINWTGFSKNT